MMARQSETGLRRTLLPNGLTVLSEHVPGVRSVAFGAWVRAASIHEPRDRMGVSHLLEHMVFKGTQRRSARELALALETLGGSLDAYTSREHTAYQARVLDEHLVDTLLEVLGSHLRAHGSPPFAVGPAALPSAPAPGAGGLRRGVRGRRPIGGE